MYRSFVWILSVEASYRLRSKVFRRSDRRFVSLEAAATKSDKFEPGGLTLRQSAERLNDATCLNKNNSSDALRMPFEGRMLRDESPRSPLAVEFLRVSPSS